MLDTVAIDATPDPIPTAAPGVDLAPIHSAVSAVFNRLDTLDQDLQTALSQAVTDHQTVVQLSAQLDTMREDRTRPIVYLFWFGAGFGFALLALYLFTFIR